MALFSSVDIGYSSLPLLRRVGDPLDVELHGIRIGEDVNDLQLGTALAEVG